MGLREATVGDLVNLEHGLYPEGVPAYKLRNPGLVLKKEEKSCTVVWSNKEVTDEFVGLLKIVE